MHPQFYAICLTPPNYYAKLRKSTSNDSKMLKRKLSTEAVGSTRNRNRLLQTMLKAFAFWGKCRARRKIAQARFIRPSEVKRMLLNVDQE